LGEQNGTFWSVYAHFSSTDVLVPPDAGDALAAGGHFRDRHRLGRPDLVGHELVRAHVVGPHLVVGRSRRES
jgi:hypothetical protein